MTSSGATERRDTDFEQILAAVMETARGRWFLAEFTRRHRGADTDQVLAAVGRVEEMLGQATKAASAAASEKSPGIDHDRLGQQVTEALVLIREGETALEGGPSEVAARGALLASRNAILRLEAALAALGRPVPARPATPPMAIAVPPTEARPPETPVQPIAQAPALDVAAPVPERSFAERLAAELEAVPAPEPRPGAVAVPSPTLLASVALPPPPARSPSVSVSTVNLQLVEIPSRPETAPKPALPLEPARPTLATLRPATLVSLRARTAPTREIALADDPTASMSRGEKIALFS